jgi:hypothetical protein
MFDVRLNRLYQPNKGLFLEDFNLQFSTRRWPIYARSSGSYKGYAVAAGLLALGASLAGCTNDNPPPTNTTIINPPAKNTTVVMPSQGAPGAAGAPGPAGASGAPGAPGAAGASASTSGSTSK